MAPLANFACSLSSTWRHFYGNDAASDLSILDQIIILPLAVGQIGFMIEEYSANDVDTISPFKYLLHPETIVTN